MNQDKIIIYSVLPRLWGNTQGNQIPNGTLAENGSGKFSAWTKEALEYVNSLGCTHIWFIGILEHATATAFTGISADPQSVVKGIAGSPYAVKDYYDVAPELSDSVSDRLVEFSALVERVHQAGLKVIIDFIPNHVARTYHSDMAPAGIMGLGEQDSKDVMFSPRNNFYYIPKESLHLPMESGDYHEYPAKATGNDCFSAYPGRNDWYETIKLNYGIDYQSGGTTAYDPVPDTWWRMLEILHYWASKGVDGFRCDMAEMVPPEFWAWVIPQLKAKYSLSFLAEIYQPDRYADYLNAGFDYLYDKVGVYDTLKAIVRHEKPADAFDQARDAVGIYQDRMCYFLENHDEQRFCSSYYAGNIRAMYPALASLALSGTNPYLHYFLGEVGEPALDAEGFSGRDGRTTIFDYWSIDSLRRLGNSYQGVDLTEEERGLLSFHRTILNMPHRYDVFCQGDYYGLNYLQGSDYDHQHLLSFLRYTKGREWWLIVNNFSDRQQEVSVGISEDVLALMELKSNSPLRCDYILSGQSQIATWTPYAPYRLTIDAYGVELLRFRYYDNNQHG